MQIVNQTTFIVNYSNVNRSDKITK